MKYVKYLLYLLLAVSVVIVVLFYLNLESDSMVQLVLNWSIVLFGICLAGVILLPLFFSTGKGIKGTLVKLVVVVVLCGISYALGSGDPVETSASIEPTAAELKYTDAGLVLTSILFVLAVLAILSGGLINQIRNR